jgi:hypothetical protein
VNVLVFSFVLALLVAGAVAWGGVPERLMGLMLAAAAIATALTFGRFESRFAGVEASAAAIDLALLFGIGVLVIKADRFWPIAMFAAHGLSVLAHAVKLIDFMLIRRAYAIAVAAPAYLTIVVLLVAVVRHRLRLARWGVDRDWS